MDLHAFLLARLTFAFDKFHPLQLSMSPDALKELSLMKMAMLF
jgi:hypothetical protein